MTEEEAKSVAAALSKQYSDGMKAGSGVNRSTIAQEQIADALARLATIAEKWFDKAYAPRRNPLDVRDAHITTLPTAEESLRQEQGQTGEATTEEWIGTREQRLLDDSTEKSPAIKTRGQKKRRASKAENKPE